ncbi:MAG TPA: hypothetical protein VFB92_00645 [Vicinamibacterales bacterium]|nr:hypothetical protein [Vicinamibacterales bacterium]
MFRHAAMYVDKLLHGAKAAERAGVETPAWAVLVPAIRRSPNRQDTVPARVRSEERKGLELLGVLAVVRFLQAHSLTIPVMRGEDGAKGRRIVHWAAANRDRVTRTLKNPAYAGAVVNSRRVQVLDRATG